ncbi:MAG: hypothetical protein OEL19_04175 [Sulfurimonas sp.]|nr:hypothetical protein [Sulfurimonas sp.]
MSDIQRASAAGMASEVAKGDALQKSKYGMGLDDKGLGKYESDMTDIEKSKSDSMFRQPEGVRKNYAANKAINPNMYVQNAEFGEESKEQSTNAKIATAGSIGQAVAMDVADAAIKTKQQQEGLRGSVESYLQGGGQSKAVAEEMAKGILSGGMQAAEAMKNVLASAGNLSFSQSSVKTGGDLSTVAGYHASGLVDQGGSLTTKAKEAMERKETTSGAEMLRKGAFMDEENKETLQAFNAKTINQLGRTAEERKKVAQNMQDMGFLQNADDIQFDENGNAVASSITPTYGNQLAKAVGTAQGGKLGENLKAMIISDAEVKNAGESVSAVKNNQYAETAGSKFDAGWEGEHIKKDIKGAAATEAATYAMDPRNIPKALAAMGHDKGVSALQGLGFSEEKAEDLYNTITSPAVGVAGTVAIAEAASRAQGKGSLVGKTYSGVKEGGAKLRDRIFGASEDEPMQKSNNRNNPEPDSKINDKGQQNTPPNSNKDSMPNNSKSVNSERGFSQGKTTDSGIHVPDNFDLRDPDTVKPKSWMGKIQDAMSGGGSFRTKLSVTAGAMALGYGVDAEARDISPSSSSTAAKAMPQQEEGFLKQA